MFGTCQGRKKAEVGHNQNMVDSPLQVRLIKMLGLKKYLLDKFVFRRKQPSYLVRKYQGVNVLFMDKQRYQPPPNYSHHVHLLSMDNHSIPVVKLVPMDLEQNQSVPCIIYSHGNSSDMGDSLYFATKLAEKFRAEYIVYDYTGYGESRLKQVGEEIICDDLELVMAWSGRAVEDVILWGFSLGTFPVTWMAARYNIGGCILQCPIGSLSCMFYDQYDVKVKFKQDHFANIDHISSIKSKILMMHSVSDEIIPIEQARLLYQKYVVLRGDINMEFIEVQKIKHNSFHRFITSNVPNDLQNQVLHFLERVTARMGEPNEQTNELETTIESQEVCEKLLRLQERIEEEYVGEGYFQQSECLDLKDDPRMTSKAVSSSWTCCGK